MDFDFSPDQDQLRDAVRRWVDRGYPFERRRAIVQGGGFAADVIAELAGLGLTGLVVDPAHGGLGLGAVEAMIVMEELGRGLVVEPYAAAALMAPALLAAAEDGAAAAPWLERIADGSALVVPALQERAARYRLDRVGTEAAEAADTPNAWRLSGTKDLVPAGAAADAWLVPARTQEGGVGLFLVERQAAGVAMQTHAMQDGAQAAQLRFERSPARRIAADPVAAEALERAVDIGIAAVCAEAVGAMERLLRMTLAHLETRRQFGVPIGSFQALRHRTADMKMALELARSMSYLASLRLDSPSEIRRLAISQAKVQLGQSMRFLGQQAIQLHGGIGCTDELAASHYFKRLTCIELSFGDTLHHLGEVAARMGDKAGVFL